MIAIATFGRELCSTCVLTVLTMLLFWLKTHLSSHMVSIDVLMAHLDLCMCHHTHHTCTVDELSKDGTFAGNDAIVAVSRCCAVNVVIHQLGAMPWEVKASPSTHKTVHIAYLRGEHYCSVQSQQACEQTLPKLVRWYSWLCCAVHLPPSLPLLPCWPLLVVMSWW